MLSFEEKKCIFRSFQGLHEKTISNGVNYIYSDSLQRGKILSTQLQPSGNGYVIGKYMDEETIRTKGYKVDNRGWINIKEFSAGDLHEIITTAMLSMSGKETINQSNVLHVKQDTNLTIIENKETKSKPTFNGMVKSYVNSCLELGMINMPIWFKKDGVGISSIQTKTFEQSMELVQHVTDIWMSAIFGKNDVNNK